MFQNSDELLKYIKDEGVEMVDVRFCDLPGVMQHFTVPVSSFDQSVFDDGLGFDGSSIRGFQAIHESDMSLFPDPTTAYIDPFRDGEDADRQLLHPRPDHRRGLLPRPAQHRAQGDGLPRQHRHRGHGVLRPRGRVLRLRQRALRDRANEGSTTSTPGEGWWNSGSEDDNRGYKTRYKGGYFPVAPYDHFGELRDEMVKNLEASGLHRRARPPRGRHRRPGGDQLPLRRAAQGRRRRDEVQVPHQERRLAQRQVGRPSCRSRSSATTARACTCTSRCGTTASRCSTTRPGTPACPTWPATTSAASSSTPRRCWRSPTRR